MYITILTCATGLFLVLALNVRLAFDSFSVSYFLRYFDYVDTEFVF